MPVVKVESGDCVASLAARGGHADWNRVWDAGENASIRAERPNPNSLVPGDLLFVPDIEAKTVALPSGTANKIIVDTLHAFVRIQVSDHLDWEVGKRYRLTIGDVVVEGAMPPRGLIEARVSPTETRGTLEIWLSDSPGCESLLVPLEIGALEPVITDAGAHARLQNVGFAANELDDAVRGFQKQNEMKVTGELDEATREKLRNQSEGI